MKNATILYRAIKAIQGFIILALGVVICIFFNNSELNNALGYCLGIVTLIYGLLTICFSYLFQRGIASFDMLSGVILSALSIFIFINPDIVNKFLPMFFGVTLLIYSLILIIELVINIISKNIKKIVGFTIASLLFLLAGIFITIFAFKQDEYTNYVVLVIGIILICIGGFLVFFSLFAPKKEILVSENSIANSNRNIESKNEIVPSKKPAKRTKKPAKPKQNKQIEQDNILEIEQKDDKKDNIN